MAAITLKIVYQLRRGVEDGYSVKELAEAFKVSEGTVRSYTKEVRKRLKASGM